MGKKTEKPVKEKPLQQTEDAVHKTPEPYQCIGNFPVDFNELCKERGITFAVPVVVGNRRGLSPVGLHDPSAVTQASKKGVKEDRKAQSVTHPQDPEALSQDEKEIVNFIGFKPKSFVIKSTYNVLKPSIFVECDNLDKTENIAEISIRRWKLDLPTINVLETCFALMPKLTTLTFWRVGLTSEAISKLADMLSKCETIKYLTIENNNEAENENYSDLLKTGSYLTKLNLRYCNITSVGSKLLADELGTLQTTGNTNLLVLDLTGCPLGDAGAAYLANSLKINRTLLSLSLSNCDIGDIGCVEFAKVISKYVLSDEEIYARRQMISERSIAEAAKSLSSVSRTSLTSTNVSPPPSRRGESKDRPQSVRSSGKDDKNKKGKGDPAKGKKDVKEEKHDKNVKGKKEEKAAPSKKTAAAVDASKNSKAKGGKSAKQPKTIGQVENLLESFMENMENAHPLLNKIEAVEPGCLMIPGNFVLLMLNLSRNRLSEESLDHLNTAILYQTTHMAQIKVNGTGMLKLFLQGNLFPETIDIFQKIHNVLALRSHKIRTPNPENE